MPSLQEIRESETCPEFEKLRSNRMVMGAFRYGLLQNQKKGQYKNVESIQKRLNAYKKDKNKEHLLDIANICMVEWVTGHGHFTATDDGCHIELA